MRKSILCSLALFLPGAAILWAQTIKIFVQKGQKYKVETSNNMTSSIKMGEEPLETSIESTSTIIFKVIDIDKDEIKMESTCTHITSRSSFMGIETSYDSDKKENNDPNADKMSKRIGKSDKIVLDYTGKVIKAEKPEMEGRFLDMAWMVPDRAGETDLFKSEFIGKEFKEGDSFSVTTAFSKEKPSTNFSLNKETISTSDTGTYRINSIRNGIASISYTGFNVLTMQMKVMDEFVTTTSKSIIRTDFLVEINTGIVISKTKTEESDMKTGASDSDSQFKNTTTVKIIRLE